MAFSGLRNHRKVVSGRLEGGMEGLEEEEESTECGGKGVKSDGWRKGEREMG